MTACESTSPSSAMRRNRSKTPSGPFASASAKQATRAIRMKLKPSNGPISNA